VRRQKKNHAIEFNAASRFAAAATQHPRETVGIITIMCATIVIFINALFLQHRPHPAPIFTSASLFSQSLQPPQSNGESRKLEGSVQAHSQLVSEIQRELARRGYFDGDTDGVWGSKTDIAARNFVKATGIKVNSIPSDNLLRAIIGSDAKARTSSRNDDPIAALIGPSSRVAAIQRALAALGYGQLEPNGVYNAETQAVIEKFEHDRHLPLTGQISDRLQREIVAVTGRPVE
jgi:peptidoglycan hydrolase-like protein with peptidoglycan-binding domain